MAIVNKQLLDLRNRNFLSIEKSIPFIKSSKEALLMIKEYVDNHPEQQKSFEELLNKHGIRLPSSGEN